MRARNLVLLTVFAVAAFFAVGSRSADAQAAFGGTFAGPHGVVSVNVGAPYPYRYHNAYPYRYRNVYPYRHHYRSFAPTYYPRYRTRRFFVAFPYPHYVVRRIYLPVRPGCGYGYGYGYPSSRTYQSRDDYYRHYNGIGG